MCNANPFDSMITIDCGTTYTKVEVETIGRPRIMRTQSSRPTSWSKVNVLDDTKFFSPKLWIDNILDQIYIAINSMENSHTRTPFISIASVSPVFVAFSPRDPNNAIAIPYWHDCVTNLKLQSMSRLERLVSQAAKGIGKQVFITDMVGYITYQLTNCYTINNTALKEASISYSELCQILEANRITIPEFGIPGTPLSNPLKKHHVFSAETNPLVCIGASDSYCVAMLARKVSLTSNAIYLGTFASLLATNASDTVSRTETEIEYNWLVSLPRFGIYLEQFANYMTREESTINAIKEIDLNAKITRESSKVCWPFLSAPVWDDKRVSKGGQTWRNIDGQPFIGEFTSGCALSLLEAPGYAFLAKVGEYMESTCSMTICGGGASSTVWTEVLSSVLNMRLRVPLAPNLSAALIPRILANLYSERYNIPCLGRDLLWRIRDVHPIQYDHQRTRRIAMAKNIYSSSENDYLGSSIDLSSCTWADLAKLAKDIVNRSGELTQYRVGQVELSISYCAVFCQNQHEYDVFQNLASSVGILANDTATGPVFAVPTIYTDFGNLNILKIRKPDETRPERGDGDFKVDNYSNFKEIWLNEKGFSLIERKDFEMIELMDDDFSDVRAYFSNPPVETHGNLPEALKQLKDK